MDISTNISADLAPFWDLIMKLRHSYDSDELDDLIFKLADTKTDSKRFLIKMEIKKLSQDVRRVIDLRPMFKDMSESFELDGVTHFLDKRAKKLLLKEYKAYGSKFTIGVFEYIMSDARARHKANPVSNRNINVPETDNLSLTEFFQRKEERLYFTSDVQLYYSDPSKMSLEAKKNFAITGKTTDISSSGLSIKIQKNLVKRLDGKVYIQMTGLEEEYQFKNPMILSYKVAKHAEKNGFIYFRLFHDKNTPNETITEFKKFTKAYIEQQKRKYRVPVENTISAVRSKVHEQFVVTRLNSLPLYLTKTDGVWHPKAKFITDNNCNIGILPEANNNSDFLKLFISMDFMQEKLSSSNSFSEYVFVFPMKDPNGKIHYVAVPSAEIFSNISYKKVAKRMHEAKKLMLYRIECTNVDSEKDYHIPSSLPSTAGEAFENLNQKPIERATKIANDIKKMAVIYDITETIDVLELISESASDINKDDVIQNIGNFVMKTSNNIPDIIESRAEINDFRAEDRFEEELSITVRPKNAKDSESIDGRTLNISTRGMKIELNSPLKLKSGDDICVTVSQFKMRGEMVSKNQHYRIVGRDSDKIYRLVITGDANYHEGRKVMRRYIYQNINRLIPSGTDSEVYGLSRALRNIYMKNFVPNYGITAKKGSARYVRTLSKSESQNLIEIGSEKKMSDLMKFDGFRSIINKKLQIINTKNPYEVFHLLVLSKKRKESGEYLIVRLVEELTGDSNFGSLFSSLESMGNPKVIQIQLTKKGRVFNKYFRDELNYLEKYAGPSAQKIGDEIRETTGIITMTDITKIIKESRS